MTNKVTVRVLKKRIKRIDVGGTLEVSEREARYLERAKLAERVNAEPAAPRKRTYKRRDMQAEE